MDNLRLLIVEDSNDDIEALEASIKIYQREKKRSIETVICKSLEDALNKVNNTFDGAIIDLKLGDRGNEGNEVIDFIHSSCRIPIAVFTGTPENVNTEHQYIGTFIKSEIKYNDLLDRLFEVYDTGITRIMGGRGLIEQAMNKVFFKNIIPGLDTWQSHLKAGMKTEKALLRYTVNLLIDFLDDHSDTLFPDEMYISPPMSERLRTGAIVKKNSSEDYYVILNPACDLAIHNGEIKTNRILTCSIEKLNISIVSRAIEHSKIEIAEDDSPEERESKLSKKSSAERLLFNLPRNSYSNYFHFLPKANVFGGGIIDFRKISTYKPSEFDGQFSKPKIQIAASFTKDIVSRFSSYYARQGQPDFDFERLSGELTNYTD